MSAFAWAELVLGLIARLVGYAFGILVLVVFWRIWREFSRAWFAKRDFADTSPQVFWRRLFCRHHHVARVRGKYGRHYTACVRCSVDVNEGKPREAWR